MSIFKGKELYTIKKLWTVQVVLRSSNLVMVHLSDKSQIFSKKATKVAFFMPDC
jgi:hypothetical protein